MHSILVNLLIFSSAAAVFVPVFRYFGLGAILAYLAAGICIGPGVLGLIQDTQVILHFSELGVVFLLFIIGLELAPQRLWALRRSIFGLGFLQVLITGILFSTLAHLMGLSVVASYVTGFGLALSSTAFAIQILDENRQLQTTHGQGSFSILMFQDLAVVPLLASLQFFTAGESVEVVWNDVVKTLVVIGLLIFVGRYVLRHVLRWIADSHVQEVFTAVSLLIVLGTSVLMESIGLSMGMGAFLAGVLLANSEYRHELEVNLLPFKGLLLGLFFIAVGMSLNLSVVFKYPHWILIIAIAMMFLKAIVIFSLGRMFRFPKESSRNMAFTLPQGGEFAFVLFSSALAEGFLQNEIASVLNASVTVTMILTPFVFSLNQRMLRKFSEISERPFDTVDDVNAEIIVAGFGRFGQIVARFLKSQDIKCTILDHSAAQVEVARKFGNIVYYGDASRADVLEAAGAKQAKFFVLAIDDPEKSVAAAKVVKSHFSNMEIIARARNRQHALDLMELGVEIIHRETLLTSLEVAKELMLKKGHAREGINRQLALFREHDEKVLKNQFHLRHDEHKFVSYTVQANRELESILAADRESS